MVGMMVDFDQGNEFVSEANPAGVYVLWHGEVPVYAGGGPNVFQRLGRHFLNRKRGRQGIPPISQMYIGPDKDHHVEFDRVRVWLVPLDQLEAAITELILHFKPRLNEMPEVASKKAVKAIQDLPGFKRLALTAKAANRRLPDEIRKVERSFQTHRDARMKVTLPKVSLP